MDENTAPACCSTCARMAAELDALIGAARRRGTCTNCNAPGQELNDRAFGPVCDYCVAVHGGS